MRQGRETVGTYELELKPDGEFSIVSVSQEMLDLHGFDESEMVGFGAWHVAIDPEDEDYVSSVIEELLAGTGWIGRMRTRTKDGEKVILELHQEVERVDGRILVHGWARDITAQAELEATVHAEEAKLRLLSEKIPVVLWSTDKNCRFTWTSGQALEALDTGGPGLVGLTLQEYFETEDPDFEPIAAHDKVLRTGESVSYTITWADRFWRCWVEPSFDELGNINGSIGVGIDVTDTHALETEALEMGRGVAHLAVAAAASKSATDDSAPATVESKGLHIDIERHKVTKNGETVGLTPIEFKLLLALARRPDRVVDRQHLLESVWGYDFPGGESPLSMTVKRLREKIEDNPHEPQRLETIRGVGYRLNSAR